MARLFEPEWFPPYHPFAAGSEPGTVRVATMPTGTVEDIVTAGWPVPIDPEQPNVLLIDPSAIPVSARHEVPAASLSPRRRLARFGSYTRDGSGGMGVRVPARLRRRRGSRA